MRPEFDCPLCIHNKTAKRFLVHSHNRPGSPAKVFKLIDELFFKPHNLPFKFFLRSPLP